MSEIKLFNLNNGHASEIHGQGEALEKTLQTLFEQNLDTLLGVRFLASEHSTGSAHGGRIDSLGIDENGCPVILEYKRTKSENVINQGLYYLDWLMDHKAEFKLLVLEQLGKDAGDAIDWSGPRLICIASDFTKFDEHAIRQINRNIDLVRYKRFGPGLLALELASSVSAPGMVDPGSTSSSPPSPSKSKGDKPLAQQLNEMDADLMVLCEEIRSYFQGLGDDVIEKPLKLYFVYRRIKNFASLIVNNKKRLLLILKLDPDTVELEEGFTRDVRDIGHWGTGDLEVRISSMADLKKALPLIDRSYEGS